MAKKLLVIDTNIISHALTPSQTLAYAKLLEIYQKDYTFMVTGYTQFELLVGSTKARQEATKEYIKENMSYVELSQVLIDFAARIMNLYKNHKSTKGMKISEADVINAALAIAKTSPVMTIDNNDYPTPFFKEIARERVSYKSSKSREVMDTVYVLEPDMVNIKYCFENNGL